MTTPKTSVPTRRRTVSPRVVMAGSALLVGTAFVYGGWLSHPGLYLGPVAGAGLAAAFLYGLTRPSGPAPLDRCAAGCLWAAAYLLLLPLPAAVRLVPLGREVLHLGAVPGGRLTWIRLDPVRYDGRPDFDAYFSTPRGGIEVCAALTRNAASHGWRPHEQLSAEGPVGSDPCENPFLGSRWWRRQGDGYYGDVLVTGYDAQREGETVVHVFLAGDDPPPDLRGLRSRLP